MVGIILFDDGRGTFGPMTDLRASFDLRTGILSSAERLQRRLGLPIKARIAPSALSALVAEKYPGSAITDLEDSGQWLLVNGRCLDAAEAKPLEAGDIEVDGEEGVLRRASLSGTQVKAWLESGEDLPEGNSRKVDAPGLIRYPWDVIATAPTRIEGDLELLLADGVYQEGLAGEGVAIRGDSRVFISHDADVGPGVVLDAREGAIVIGPKCQIGSGSVLVGPLAIGEETQVSALTHIKPGTLIGPHCRIGGEVGGTVFQGYANKSHHGHLGDSWVGEWANLGAGTVNSNLLNTYGEVPLRLEPDGPMLRSGRTHMGCVIGDHVKTAIGTRIMTGSVLGTGSMIASTRPPAQTTARFSWVTDRDGHRYRFGKFIEVARIFMARRGLKLGDAYQQRLKAMHEATA